MEKAPPPVRSLVPEVPEPLNHLISRVSNQYPETLSNHGQLATALDRLDADGVATGSNSSSACRSSWWSCRSRSCSWRRPVPAQQTVAPEEHPEMSVLIADFDNRAIDSVLERCSSRRCDRHQPRCSTTFPRKKHRDRREAQCRPAARREGGTFGLDKRGIDVILAGAIEPEDSGYTISVRAIHRADGKSLGEASALAGNKGCAQAVGSVASKFVDSGRCGARSARLAAAEPVSTNSLEALADYSRGQDLLVQPEDAVAIPYYKRATERDAISACLCGVADATRISTSGRGLELWKKALPLLDRMTEREYRSLAT